jgi:hypothetical protein
VTDPMKRRGWSILGSCLVLDLLVGAAAYGQWIDVPGWTVDFRPWTG